MRETSERYMKASKSRLMLLSGAALLAAAVCCLVLLNGRLQTGELAAICSGLRLGAAAAVCVAGAGLLFFGSRRPDRFFMAAALALGLCYLFYIVPLSAADEQTHYKIALTMSSRILTGGTAADASYVDFRGFDPNRNTADGLMTLIRGLFRETTAGYAEDFTHAALDTNYPHFYVPQVLVFLLVQLLGLNRLWLYILGGGVNLLLYALLVKAAICRIPRFRLPMLLCALTPMALQQAASLSSDGLIIALSFLVFAELMAALDGKGNMTAGEKWRLLLPLALLTPAKQVYGAFLLLLFLLPGRRFRSKKEKWTFIASVFGAALLSLAFCKLWYAGHAAGPADSDVPMVDLSYVLSHPVECVMMSLRTLFPLGIFFYVETAIGSQLSGLSLNISISYIFCMLLVLLAAALIGEPEEKKLTVGQRLTFLGVSVLVVLLTMAGMLISWTPVGCQSILGIQGRYFLPILPLVLMALRPAWLHTEKSIALPCCGAFLLLHLLVLNDVVHGFLG